MENFNFKLYKGDDELVVQRIFSADVYNQTTRYSVDVRGELNNIIHKLRKQLSTNEKTLDYNNQNLFSYKLEYLQYLHKKYGHEKYYNNTTTQSFVFELSISSKDENGDIIDNTIVKRDFDVYGFDERNLFSVELNELIYEICDDISDDLKEQDKRYMWESFDLTDTYNIPYSMLRDLSDMERLLMLENIDNETFIKKQKYKLRNFYTTNNNFNQNNNVGE